MAALAARKDTTIIWHLIQALEKLRKGVAYGSTVSYLGYPYPDVPYHGAAGSGS